MTANDTSQMTFNATESIPQSCFAPSLSTFSGHGLAKLLALQQFFKFSLIPQRPFAQILSPNLYASHIFIVYHTARRRSLFKSRFAG